MKNRYIYVYIMYVCTNVFVFIKTHNSVFYICATCVCVCASVYALKCGVQLCIHTCVYVYTRIHMRILGMRI